MAILCLAINFVTCDVLQQVFDVLTKHKPKGRRWVTKEQYIRYFMMCYAVLYPDNGMSESEQRESLQVSEYLVGIAASALLSSVLVC